MIQFRHIESSFQIPPFPPFLKGGRGDYEKFNPLIEQFSYHNYWIPIQRRDVKIILNIEGL